MTQPLRSGDRAARTGSIVARLQPFCHFARDDSRTAGPSTPYHVASGSLNPRDPIRVLLATQLFLCDFCAFIAQAITLRALSRVGARITGKGPIQELPLCHCLCHNHAIPARVATSPAVSLSHTQKAVDTRETRMNTASPCRSISLTILSYQSTRRFDTEEVAGSNPVVPTI
jgi:hypothetical protein